MNRGVAILHEVETPAAGLAPEGRLAIRGWCAAPATTFPPQIRLACGSALLAPISRPERADVADSLKLPASAGPCGFVFAATLPFGAHLARLEASVDGVNWHHLRQFVVTATDAPLQAVIEYPAEATIRDSVRIQGWCAHPRLPLAHVELHYGNRHVACEYGLPRQDVPTLLPGAPSAERAGLITVKNIPVGHGPLRICARDSAGRLHFTPTDRRIEVRTDEENPEPLDLSATAARLGPLRAPAPTAPPRRTEHPRRILFVLYGDMTSNSAIHVAALANELIARGHECVVAVPRNPDTVRYHHNARFRCVEFADCVGPSLLFENGAAPEIVHAWTTSELVRRFALATCAATGAVLIVHLEDDELSILSSSTGLTPADLATLPPEKRAAVIGDNHSHPVHRKEFLERAAGCTVIVDRLRELVPPGRPSTVFWPAAAPEFFERPVPWGVREALGWGTSHTVLFYHGNLHPTNRDEMAALYEAVVLLNRAGTATTLLRAGRDFCALPGDLDERAAPHVITLGRIDDHRHLGPLMALADYFVQPGESGSFNDFRFPSKLPEFLATGRPVILPRTNLGTVLKDGEDAFVLDRADAVGIADAVRALRANPALAARLATGAARFAREHFSWQRSTDQVEDFYDRLAPHGEKVVSRSAPAQSSPSRT